jgi:hypothetical protein
VTVLEISDKQGFGAEISGGGGWDGQIRNSWPEAGLFDEGNRM